MYLPCCHRRAGDSRGQHGCGHGRSGRGRHGRGHGLRKLPGSSWGPHRHVLPRLPAGPAARL